jgi:hypothetical protein
MEHIFDKNNNLKERYHNFMLKNNEDYNNIINKNYSLINLSNFVFTKDELEQLKNTFNLEKEVTGNMFIDENKKVVKTEYKVSNNYSSTNVLESSLTSSINFHSHPFSNRIMENPSFTDLKYIINISLFKMFEIDLNKNLETKKFYNYHLVFTPEGIYKIKLLFNSNQEIKKMYNIYKKTQLLEMLSNTIYTDFEKKHNRIIKKFEKVKDNILKNNKNKKEINDLINKIIDFHKSDEFKTGSLIKKYMDKDEYKKLVELNTKVYDRKLEFYKKFDIDYFSLFKLYQKFDNQILNYYNKIDYLYSQTINELKQFNMEYQQELFEYKIISPFFLNLMENPKIENISHDLKVKIDSNIQKITSKKMKKNSRKTNNEKIKFINEKLENFYKKTKIQIVLVDYQDFKIKNLTVIQN